MLQSSYSLLSHPAPLQPSKDSGAGAQLSVVDGGAMSSTLRVRTLQLCYE
jgi:hypothetical protein